MNRLKVCISRLDITFLAHVTNQALIYYRNIRLLPFNTWQPCKNLICSWREREQMNFTCPLNLLLWLPARCWHYFLTANRLVLERVLHAETLGKRDLASQFPCLHSPICSQIVEVDEFLLQLDWQLLTVTTCDMEYYNLHRCTVQTVWTESSHWVSCQRCDASEKKHATLEGNIKLNYTKCPSVHNEQYVLVVYVFQF